ncbi:hypothetical protein D3C77_433440 [compost metagenome]
MLRKLELRAVMRMHFRQQFDVIRVSEDLHPIKELINFRLNEKTARSQLLDHISDGVQPYNFNILLFKVFKEGLKKLPGLRRMNIEIDLLRRIRLAKRRPYLLFLRAIAYVECRVRQRPAQEHLIDVILNRFTVLPNLIQR